jgi:hypothetical protein
MTDTPARPRKTTLSRPAPLWEASTWGPYFGALFPPQEVSPWIAWKIRSTGVGIARRLWDQREQLRGQAGDVHGTDPARWPVQHPGVVLDAVPSIAHGACLGCQWTNFVHEFSGTGPGNQYIGNDQADLDNVLPSPWLSASAAGWRSNYVVQQPR